MDGTKVKNIIALTLPSASTVLGNNAFNNQFITLEQISDRVNAEESNTTVRMSILKQARGLLAIDLSLAMDPHRIGSLAVLRLANSIALLTSSSSPCHANMM